MAQNTNEWKFRTKRERQRLLPYSRPINDSRNERINNLNTNNSNNNDINNTNSLLSRISTSVKHLLIPNWLRNTTNFINNNNVNNDNNSNISENLTPNQSNEGLNEGLNTGLNTNLWDERPTPTPFSDHNWVPLKSPLTQVNPNDYLSKPSTSSTIFTITDDMRQSTSCSNQNKPQVIDVLEGDDRSSSSSATASSTSGCSSLVPSHSDNVLRLGLPLETMRKELAKIKSRQLISGSDSTINKPLIVEQKRANTNFNSNNNLKQFSVQKFMSPSSVLPQKSHFYEGKTIYGGANVSRASRLAGTTPYSLSSRHSLAPVMRVQVNNSRRIDTNDQLSTSTKKIFEKLEKASTPIQDAKRVPLYGSQFKNYFQSSQLLLRSNKRPKIGPPIASTLTPSKATIDPRNKPIKWELTQVIDNEEKIGNKDKLSETCDNYLLIGSKNNELNENKVTEGGGKITRKDTKRTKNDDLMIDESVENALSSVTPLSIPSGISLPKFNFGNSSSFQKQSSANKALPTTTLTKVEDESSFKFSLPTLRKQEKNIEFDNKNESIGSTPFTFSSPKGVVTQIPSIKLDFSGTKDTQKDSNNSNESLKTFQITPQLSDDTKIEEKTRFDTTKSKEEKWVCECLYYNNFSEKKCMACQKERGIKPVAVSQSSVIQSSWGQKFKAPEGSWNCQICMINNSSDKTICAACETPKPGLQTNPTKDNIKSSSELWQCFYCKENNEMSRNTCISCEKVKTAIATKADLDKLYGGQTFKFGISEDKDKAINKENIKDKDKESIKANPNPLFSKSSESSSQITGLDSTPFTFGSTIIAKSTVEPKATITSTAEPLFKFGLTPTKPTDIKPNESSTTTAIETDNKIDNLFQFGAQTSSITTTIPTVAPEFVFGNQSKPNEVSETKKTVSFELEKKSNESTKPLQTTNNKVTSDSGFQFGKVDEDKSQLFTFGANTKPGFSSSLNTSIFGSNTASNNSAVTTATSQSNTSLTNTFNPLSNEIPNKNITSLFGLPVTTSSSSPSLSSSLLINNKFNTGLTTIPVTTTGSQEVGKNLFSLTTSTIKPFDTLKTSQTPIVSTSTPTLTSTTSSSQNSLVFGTSNTNLQSLSSIAANVTKPNFSFMNANTSNQTTEPSFAPNKLFGSTASKPFTFGNAPLSNSQTGFSSTLPSTNATPLTSSTFSFGLNSNNSNNTNNDNNSTKSSTNSLFTFGQNSEPFASSVAQKPPNSINSGQFNFGVNPTTGQNNTNIFGNALNSSQSSLSFNQSSLTTNTNTPFNFGFGGPPQPTPSVPQIPQLQAPQQQQQPLQPPPYNFSQQPSFDFARMNSPANQSSPVFQFSAEQTGRSIKKAKRRLNPT